MDDEECFSNLSYMVYVSVRAEPDADDWVYRPLVADIDDVIVAGIKALGLEKDFIFVESDMRDSDW